MNLAAAIRCAAKGHESQALSLEFYMFTVSVETQFWASHRLAFPDGSKEPAHPHNWLVTADVGSDKLNSTGLVIDFRRLKAMVEVIVARFSDTSLDKNDYFQRNSSSAETIAKYIYEQLEPKLPDNIRLNYIRVVEQPGCAAKFAK
ncbi:MAG TPA: 6-carboxytetrahydropterin synthase [Phycisphaerales bacterium]|nr:6-carboxytetrahydropterin synthase [Phycisphaerales bacterium]